MTPDRMFQLRTDALAIVRAGIAAVDAGRLTERALASQPLNPVVVIAAGKAAGAMARAAHRVVGTSIRTGLIVSPETVAPLPRFTSIIGGHPVPTLDSEAAGRQALTLAGLIAPGETLLVLLSGGASAMLAVPASGITLDDKRETTRRLLMAGADIHALNAVRKHLSAIKGGWLAASTDAPCRALLISDVVGDDPSVIASGPTVGDVTTFADALVILQRCGGLAAFPANVVSRLEAGASGALPETPKPGDPRLSRVSTIVIGSGRLAVEGAAIEAAARGYAVIRVAEPIVGEARHAAPTHVRDALSRIGTTRPTCIISGGETTVRVTGNGRGGRNQEFALAAAESLALAARPSVLASVGTDGIDGPTDAAGAIADSTTCARAVEMALGPPERYLTENNAYAFFDALGDLVITGPTGTNVGDLQVLVVDPSSPGAMEDAEP
jgi:glycerate 2-kinase